MVHLFFMKVEVCFLNSVFKFAEAEWGVSRSPSGGALRRDRVPEHAHRGDGVPDRRLAPEPAHALVPAPALLARSLGAGDVVQPVFSVLTLL